MPHARRRHGRRLAAALVLPVILATSACTGDSGDPDQPAARPTPSPMSTPLEELDTGTVTVARDEFCSRVAPATLKVVLGREPRASDTWRNGQRATLAPGVTDVAHEFGCSWTAGRTTARAWVFAPPVTTGEAAGLRRTTAGEDGCHPVAGAPRFGSRSVAVRCSGRDGVTTSFHGLFGDAWLSCSLQAPSGAGLLDRTGRWCVTVVEAATA